MHRTAARLHLHRVSLGNIITNMISVPLNLPHTHSISVCVWVSLLDRGHLACSLVTALASVIEVFQLVCVCVSGFAGA